MIKPIFLLITPIIVLFVLGNMKEIKVLSELAIIAMCVIMFSAGLCYLKEDYKNLNEVN